MAKPGKGLLVPSGLIAPEQPGDGQPHLHTSERHEFMGARIYRSTNGTHTNNGGYQWLGYEAIEFDTNNFVDGGSGVMQFKIPLSGYYHIKGQVVTANPGDQKVVINSISLNSTTVVEGEGARAISPGGGHWITSLVNTTRRYNKDDIVRTLVFQDSGGNLTIVAGLDKTFLEIEYLGERLKTT